MDKEFLSMLAGTALSLLFSYVPGFSDWYDTLDGIYKRLVMLGLLFAGAAAIFGLSCAGVVGYTTCDAGGAIVMVKLFAEAAMANQAAFLLSPRKKQSCC